MKPITETEREAVFHTPLAPHPDGQPWRSCCRGKYDNEQSCQCFMRKPRNAQSRHDLIPYGIVADLKKENGRFFCVHRRTDDGFYRECAGWAAKFGKERINERENSSTSPP